MIIPKHNILNKLSIFQGLEEYKDDRFPNSIFYLKNGKIYFELDVENHILYCSNNLVWSVFSEQSKLDYYETQRVIKNVLERHTNWGSITPFKAVVTFRCMLERHTNWGSITPFIIHMVYLNRWKDILIGGQ